MRMNDRIVGYVHDQGSATYDEILAGMGVERGNRGIITIIDCAIQNAIDTRRMVYDGEKFEVINIDAPRGRAKRVR